MPDKAANLKACLSAKGTITAAAMDQRGSLKKALKSAGSDPTDEDLVAFKRVVTETLTPYASAILLDPVYGLPASEVRSKSAGLLLAYEKSGYDTDTPGRQGDLLPRWSVRRLAEAGANAVKVLLYYNPFDDADILEHKHAFTERVGAECEAEGLPFFLEPVTYDDAVKNPAELAGRKPEMVTATAKEFSKDAYRVDVLKLELPVDAKYVEGLEAAHGNRPAYSQGEASEHLHALAEAAGKPFIFLSAGVDMAQFVEALTFAGEAGVPYNGVLCGRATWKGGIPVYAKEGEAAFRDWLNGEGVANIEKLNEVLDMYAKPLQI